MKSVVDTQHMLGIYYTFLVFRLIDFTGNKKAEFNYTVIFPLIQRLSTYGDTFKNIKK